MSMDDDLRTLLNAEADRFETPARIPSRLLRRARVQRLGAAAGTALGAAAILMAAVALAGSLVGTGATTPDRRSLPADTPTPGTVIDGSDGHAAYVVATGSEQGASWVLSAHEDESGLCVDIEHDQGGGGSCGEFKPSRLAMSINSGDGDDPLLVQGAVGPEVDSLEVRYLDSEGTPTVETILRTEDFYDAPRQISLPVRFFLVFLPRGATPQSVRALDAAGEIVDEQKGLDQVFQTRNPQIGPEELIAKGRVEGMEWELVARPHAQGPCFEFFLGAGQSQGGGGSCSLEADGPGQLALSQTTFENQPAVAPAFGVAPGATKEVTLELEDGSTVAGELFDAPSRFGEVRFFLLFTPDANTKGTVVASDESGEVLQRGKLCAAEAPPGSTC